MFPHTTVCAGSRSPTSCFGSLLSNSQILIRAAKKLGTDRLITPHASRHCFATYLLDQGTDVHYI